MGYDLIMLTKQLHEIGPCDYDGDFEIGYPGAASNTLQFSGVFPSSCGGMYLPGTEFGGLFEYHYEKTGSNVITKKGYTWRGLLSQSIIIPDPGNDYKVVSGDANAVIKSLLQDLLGGFFYVPDEESGITITNYTFPLYCTTLDGLMTMLDEYGARLYIHADKTAAGEAVRVTAEAAPKQTLIGTLSEDSPVPLTYTDNQMGINHLVCMGSGQLQNRLRVDLYADNKGRISTTKYYTGFKERTAYYDYSSADSVSSLTSYGKKRLKELMSGQSLQVDSVNVENEVGDLISGYVNKTSVTVPIERKVLSVKGGVYKTTYRLKGGT